MSQLDNNEDGFTLIEVLIALTIFAIGLLGLAGMQITAIKGSSTAHSISAKVALGGGVLEEIMALSGDESEDNINGINDLLTTDRTNVPWPIVDPDIDGAGTCSVTVTVDSDPVIGITTYTGLTQIVVTTSNPNGQDVSQEIMKRRY